MPAASKAVKFTHIPKGAGKGGMFSNSTSHDSDTDTLVRVYDFLIDGGKWCPRPAETVFSNILPGHAQAMFIYNFYNEISTVGTSALLVDVDAIGGATNAHAVYRVEDASVGFNIIWGPLGQTPTGFKPRVNFSSVKNRCYMTSGRGLGYFDKATQVTAAGVTTWTITVPSTSNLQPSMVGMIVLCDDGAGGTCYVRIISVPGGGPTYPTCVTTSYVTAGGAGAGPHDFYIGYDTPVIYDGTAGAGTGRTYNWGFLPQQTNLTYHIADAPQSSGILGVATNVGAVATWVSGDKFDALSPGQNFYMQGSGFNRTIISVDSPTQVTCNGGLGPAGPNYAFQAGMGSLKGTCNFVGPNTVNFATGDPYAPANGDPFLKVGDRVYVAGQRAIVQALPIPAIVLVTFDGVPPPNGAYDFTGDFGPLVWDVPSSTAKPTYKYMVAYWDPITGHCSNGSQAIEVSNTRPDNDGVTTTLTGIITNGDSRFTQIIIARTAKGGSSFKPLAIRPNANGPLKYVDSQNDDTKLGTVGPGDLRIEQNANLPPPNTGSYIAYWDGRFWMADNQSIGIVYMSKSTQEMEGIVGVAEECWPQTVAYQRTIPDSDGRITGLRTVGENLFILTDLAIYSVVGQGLGPSSYGLQRISAKGSGTTALACANLPAEDSQSGDVLVHYGNDQRVYFLYGQGGDLSYSYPIQDQFTQNPVPAFWWRPETTSVGIVHDKRATYVLLSKTDAYEPPYSFLYDLDRKVWLETSLPPYSYVEGLYNGILTRLVAGSPSLAQPKAIYRAMSDPANSIAAGTSIITQFVNVPETNRLDDKILQAVFMYCDDPNIVITMEAYVDEKYSFGDVFPLVRMPTVDTKYLAYLDSPNARIYQPAPNVIVRGRTFRIRIVMLSGILLTSKIPAFACLWSHAEADDNIGGNL